KPDPARITSPAIAAAAADSAGTATPHTTAVVPSTTCPHAASARNSVVRKSLFANTFWRSIAGMCFPGGIVCVALPPAFTRTSEVIAICVARVPPPVSHATVSDARGPPTSNAVLLSVASLSAGEKASAKDWSWTTGGTAGHTLEDPQCSVLQNSTEPKYWQLGPPVTVTSIPDICGRLRLTPSVPSPRRVTATLCVSVPGACVIVQCAGG